MYETVPQCIFFLSESASLSFGIMDFIRLFIFSALLYFPVKYLAFKFDLANQDNRTEFKPYLASASAIFGLHTAYVLQNSMYIPCNPGQAPSIEFIKIIINNLIGGLFLGLPLVLAVGFILIVAVDPLLGGLLSKIKVDDDSKDYQVIALTYLVSCILSIPALYLLGIIHI